MARKSNFESKPVVSAGSTPTSSSKKTKRTSARSAAHRKALSTEIEPAPEFDGAAAVAVSNPDQLSNSISNLSQAVSPESDREAVAKLAYYYWEMRGRQAGSSEEDWLRAERELSNRRSLIGPQ